MGIERVVFDLLLKFNRMLYHWSHQSIQNKKQNNITQELLLMKTKHYVNEQKRKQNIMIENFSAKVLD